MQNLEHYYETHVFNCIRWEHPDDKGFKENLTNLLFCVIHSDNVKDDNIKTVAKSILSNIIDYQYKKFSLEDIKKIQEDNKQIEEEKKIIE